LKKSEGDEKMIYDESTIRSILSGNTPEDYLEKVGTHEKRYLVYRMLQALYEYQTRDEQYAETTKHRNNVGFNGPDAGLLSGIAKRSQKYQNLTAKQAKLVASRLVKYTGQLVKIAAEKAQQKLPATQLAEPVNKPTSREEKKAFFAKQMALVEPPCSCCGANNHSADHCDIYWKNEFAKQEAIQEQQAFENKMKARAAMEGV
jgi:hypothetical protein